MAAARKPFSIDIAKPLSEADRERLKKEEPKKQSREEWRKQKELEEARKLGNAPAEVDEEGKDINPHIPQYISTVPWYVDPTQRASLKHQRAQPEKQQEYSNLNEWYHRGVPSQPIPSKFRKGACTNCGSMTHKKKDCLERPRKVGAKFTGQGIAPDDFAQPELSLDFDGKRDRWNGYDPNRHQEVVDDYAKIEVAKQAVKSQKLQEDILSGKMSDAVKDDDEVEDEDKYADKIDMPGTNFDSKRRITVRNLRIREDIAKYLRNLNPNSAYYDPKTRSMRENPYEETGKTVNEVDYAGDNFVRYTGDTHDMAKMQMFAMEAGDKGVEVHLQADPTRLEMLQKSFDVRKDDFKKNQRDSILSKYGGLEHLDAPPRELLLAQTEDYVEYSRQGSVIKGQEKARTKSKYVEDLYINNHTSVWGSYWKKGIWGFACCHSTIKQSYCTGEAGKGIQNSDAVSMPKPFTKKDERLQKLEEKNTAWEKALGISGRCVEVEAPEDVEEARDDEDVEEETQQKSLLQQHREKLESDQKKEKKRKKKKEKKRKRKRKHKRKVETSSSSSSDESEVDVDEPPEKRERKRMLKEVEREKVEKERKLQEALKKERDHAAKVERLMKMDERKRPYNSASKEATVEPTAEEMEAYMMRKKNEDDPMNFFT